MVSDGSEFIALVTAAGAMTVALPLLLTMPGAAFEFLELWVRMLLSAFARRALVFEVLFAFLAMMDSDEKAQQNQAAMLRDC